MRPVVLCFSGLDPSGGAGLQADIEAVGSAGALATVACTAITVQSSQKVFGFEPVSATLLKEQAIAVLEDLPVKAIKSGMLATTQNIDALIWLFEHKIMTNTPFVFDPVLVANTGDGLGDKETLAKEFARLLPFATLVTPNTHELRALAGEEDLHVAAKKLCQMGAKAVLVKTSHDFSEGDIEQFLYVSAQMVYKSTMPRLAGEFHGSGCSLASYIAGRLALGDDLISAVKASDAWIYQTLSHADVPHPNNPNAQKIPNRFV